MRVRSMILAAAMAVAGPSALHAADMAGYLPGPPTCGGLHPVDTYVPPQVAYIVACTTPLPPRVAVLEVAPTKHGHGQLLSDLYDLFLTLLTLGHGPGTVVSVKAPGPYGPHATHDPERYEGKLVYLKAWSADRPPVHFLVVPK